MAVTIKKYALLKIYLALSLYNYIPFHFKIV